LYLITKKIRGRLRLLGSAPQQSFAIYFYLFLSVSICFYLLQEAYQGINTAGGFQTGSFAGIRWSIPPWETRSLPNYRDWVGNNCRVLI